MDKKHIPLLRAAALALAIMLLGGCLAGCSSKKVAVADGGRVECRLEQPTDQLTFSGSVTLDFSADAAAAVPFNRFDLTFSLTAPVHGSIAYVKDGKAPRRIFISAKSRRPFLSCSTTI